jgi:hypothetical protein
MPRRSLGRLASLVLVLVLPAAFVAGCGGHDRSADARALLRQTLEESHRVDSGRVLIDLAIDQQAATGGGPLNLQLSGPFERGAAGELPKLDLSLRGHRPNKTIDAGLTSTGSQLFVRRDRQAYVLPPALVAVVRQGYQRQSASGGGRPLLGRLGVALRWLRDPRIVGDATVAGTPTTHVTSGVDVGALLDDLNRLASRVRSLPVPAGSLPGLDAGRRKKLVDSVKSATVDVFSGKTDKTIRRFSVHLGIAIPPAQQGASGLRSLDVTLNIELAALNQPQSITAPANSKPISRLPGGAGGALGLGGGTGFPGTGTAPVPSGQRYARCIAQAGSDVVRAQRCISLLGS